MILSVLCSSISETDKLAQKFAQAVKDKGIFAALFGQVGAGKTAFVQAVCRHLGVKESVTSPSFVILNEYKTGVLPVYHFDLYRLEEEGVSSIINELEEYSEGRIITFVEWAEFSGGTAPFDRIEIRIKYIDENKREFVFEAFGKKSSEILKEIEQQ